MKEKVNELRKELKYLLDSEIEREILQNAEALKDENLNVKNLANEIYLKRGIDYKKLNHGLFNNLSNTLLELSNTFKDRDKVTKRRMIIEIIYIIVFLLLIKVPFDLVRDIGYEYLEILNSNTLLYNIWHLAFLLLYTIVIICTFILLIRNFNKKYQK